MAALLIIYHVELNKINQRVLLECVDNTSVILAEVDHFFTASVDVTEDTEHIGDFHHFIDVYQLDSKCSHVPEIKYSYTVTGTNLTNINETTFYALPGFSMTYSICGTTNSTKEPERLEMVLIAAPHSETIDFLHPGTNNTWNCKERTFPLNQSNYYTVLFLPPTHQTSFKFNATYGVSEIDPRHLHRGSVANHTLQKDSDSRKFPLKFGFTHSCFVATIRDNPDTYKEIVHIRLNFTNQNDGFIIGGGVGVVVIVLVLHVIMSVYACYLIRKTR